MDLFLRYGIDGEFLVDRKDSWIYFWKFFTNPLDGNISIIDTNFNQVVDAIDIPEGVLIIEKVSDKNKIYVTAEDQNKVFVYDTETNERLGEIDLGEPEISPFLKLDKSYGQREYTSFQTNGIDHAGTAIWIPSDKVAYYMIHRDGFEKK